MHALQHWLLMHGKHRVQVFLEDHNPSRQSKPQYKSAIWTHSPEQEAAAAKALQSWENTRGQKVSLPCEYLCCLVDIAAGLTSNCISEHTVRSLASYSLSMSCMLCGAQHWHRVQVATDVAPASTWTDAEGYHQKYSVTDRASTLQ